MTKHTTRTIVFSLLLTLLFALGCPTVLAKTVSGEANVADLEIGDVIEANTKLTYSAQTEGAAAGFILYDYADSKYDASDRRTSSSVEGSTLSSGTYTISKRSTVREKDRVSIYLREGYYHCETFESEDGKKISVLLGLDSYDSYGSVFLYGYYWMNGEFVKKRCSTVINGDNNYDTLSLEAIDGVTYRYNTSGAKINIEDFYKDRTNGTLNEVTRLVLEEAISPAQSNTEPIYHPDYEEEQETQSTPVTQAQSVLCRTLNVRSTPSTEFTRIGRVHRGDVLQVLEIADGWAKIQYSDGVAYVCAKYIK